MARVFRVPGGATSFRRLSLVEGDRLGPGGEQALVAPLLDRRVARELKVVGDHVRVVDDPGALGFPGDPARVNAVVVPATKLESAVDLVGGDAPGGQLAQEGPVRAV